MYNSVRPLVMHIDLNSCFASIEQQARPLLRGRPIAVTNRLKEGAIVVTASYEAKAFGVKVGMHYKEAKKLSPDIVMVETDPPKYRYVYHQLMRIMGDYSAHVRMKSIDEGVIDFSESTRKISNRDLKEIGREIKQRLKCEVGVAMRCNVGIGPNRFLAKTAASLHKPDGLDEINADNLRAVYETLGLTDLTGINYRLEKRLNAVGIMTPLEFLDADEMTLQKVVFKSIDGLAWYKRLRGFEVDKVDHALKSVGRQYVLDGYRLNREKVLTRLHHLCEEVGKKLRSQSMVARSVYVFVHDYDQQIHQARWTSSLPFFSNQTIFSIARRMFADFPNGIKAIGVTCYNLESNVDTQFSLFGDESVRNYELTGVIDEVNNRYGPRTVFAANTLESNQVIKQKVPFGSTRYL